MDEPLCPYLRCETTGSRPLTDLSEPLAADVTRTWYCGHPFHGIEVELGGSRAVAAERCAACGLPHAWVGDGGRQPEQASPQRDDSAEGAA